MKTLITPFLLVLALQSALSETPRLIITSDTIFIKQRADVILNIYLWNEGKKVIKIPPLKSATPVYLVNDIKGIKLPNLQTTVQLSTNPPGDHNLRPGSMEKATISAHIPADPGNLVEVYVEIGYKPAIRSNSILFFCPPTTEK